MARSIVAEAGLCWLARASINVGLHRPSPGRIVLVSPVLYLGQRIRCLSLLYICEEHHVGRLKVRLHREYEAEIPPARSPLAL